MQEGEVVRTQAALDEHEAHLRARGPGQAHLYAHTRRHDQGCDDRRRHANHDQEQLCRGCVSHQWRQPDH